MNKSLSQMPTTKLSNLEKGLQNLINLKIMNTASSGIKGFGKSIIETAAEFEAGMSKVKAITGANSEEMKQLTEQARKLGRETRFTATESAEAMSYLGMAGWKTEEILKGMPALLSLAAAGGTDLARTADIVSDNLTAFGLAADQSMHMADVYATVITKDNTVIDCTFTAKKSRLAVDNRAEK